MRFYIVLSALVATVVADDPLMQFPKCAAGCIEDAIITTTPCKTNDLSCVCMDKHKGLIKNASQNCIINACGVSTALNEVVPIAKERCKGHEG